MGVAAAARVSGEGKRADQRDAEENGGRNDDYQDLLVQELAPWRFSWGRAASYGLVLKDL